MKKIVATLLLDLNDNYVLNDGSLPKRPQWDKALLKTFVAGESLSKAGYDMLPRSMQSIVTIDEPTFTVTIPEIDASADILLVSRSYTKGKGKQFKFDNFKQVLKTGQLEIWRRK